MPKTMRLPDAMPEIDKHTLLLVCDAHQCKLIDVGQHTLLIAGNIESKKNTFTDHEGQFRSPASMGKGGMISTSIDVNPLEKNRMREFAHNVWDYTARHVRDQKIEEIYISAPGKFLHVLKENMPKQLKKTVKETLEGNFMKEKPKDLLIRFQPELADAMKELKEMENYSPRKQPPKKSRAKR